MNNQELFEEKLNKCGEIKYEVSQIHNRIMAKLKNVYSLAFKSDKKNFNSLKNMQYYKCGVKTPDAKDKLLESLNDLVNLVNLYEFIGDNSIKDYLMGNGIKLEVIVPKVVDETLEIEKESKKEFAKSWDFSMPGEAVPATKKELLNKILERSLQVQKDIDNKNEQIEDGAKAVEDSCDVSKPLFMKALGIKYKELQKHSVDNELVKVEEQIDKTQDIIDYFKENLNISNSNVATIEKDNNEIEKDQGEEID